MTPFNIRKHILEITAKFTNPWQTTQGKVFDVIEFGQHLGMLNGHHPLPILWAKAFDFLFGN